MAYDEHLADRIRENLERRSVPFTEKKMFGGLCFLVDDKMLAGIVRNQMMARVGPHGLEERLKRPGAKDMDFTGRPMKGYLFIDPEGIDMETDLDYWLQACLDFNPEAKASKRKK